MNQQIFKKYLILAVSLSLLITATVQAINTKNEFTNNQNQVLLKEETEITIHQNTQKSTLSINSTELVDQSNGGGSGCGRCSNAGELLLTKGVFIAQSFTPSYDILSKATVYLAKYGSPSSNFKVTLSIRESLQGEDLRTTNTSAEAGFIIFDFEDLTVIPGNTYYMICQTETSSSSNTGYGWFYSAEDSYEEGSSYSSENGNNWQESDVRDMFFQTYWKDFAPDKPVVEGIRNGHAQKRYTYTFSTEDPESNKVSYFIDWGDGRTWNWFGPFTSGEEVTKSHQWSREGEYEIRVKAKDTYGVESDWSDPFTISMPKSRVIQNPIIIFLQNHPDLFPLIQRVLNLQ